MNIKRIVKLYGLKILLLLVAIPYLSSFYESLFSNSAMVFALVFITAFSLLMVFNLVLMFLGIQPAAKNDSSEYSQITKTDKRNMNVKMKKRLVEQTPNVSKSCPRCDASFEKRSSGNGLSRFVCTGCGRASFTSLLTKNDETGKEE